MVNPADIKKIELFYDSPPEFLEKIATGSSFLKAEQGEMLFFEGEQSEWFYALVSGSVKLFKSGPEAKEVIMRLVSPGEVFAEVILFERDTYPVSAEVMIRSKLLKLSAARIRKTLDDPVFRDAFCALLMRRQRYLAERIMYLTACDVEERFFRFLKDRYGQRTEYSVDVQKKDLAQAIGAMPETLSRLLNRLKRRRVITWEDKVLRLSEDFWDENPY